MGKKSGRGKNMTEKEKMLSGKLFYPADEELAAFRKRARNLCQQYNQTTEDDKLLRQKIIAELFGKVGKHCCVHPSFHCDYGFNIKVGDHFYANYDCIILDIGEVIIGDNVMLGPRVCLYTAGHPLDADVRATGIEFGKSIIIENNVWIGGSCVINPGVHIGENSIIGAGAVVVKDIPANVVAVGNPCRVLRRLSGDDRDYWQDLFRQHDIA